MANEFGIKVNKATVGRWLKKLEEENRIENDRKGVQRRPRAIGDGTASNILNS